MLTWAQYQEHDAALSHYEGLGHIVRQLGGLENIAILGKLHILIAVWFTSRELLVKPLFPASSESHLCFTAHIRGEGPVAS